MFVILCYDVGIKRNAKVKKTVRKFLRLVQKSVCEGHITEGKLRKMLDALAGIIDPEEDSIAVYKTDSPSALNKICLGLSEKNEDFII